MAKIYRVIQIKIELVGLRKCPYDHRLTNESYLSAITGQTFLRVSTYNKMAAANINRHRYGTKVRHCHDAVSYCKLQCDTIRYDIVNRPGLREGDLMLVVVVTFFNHNFVNCKATLIVAIKMYEIKIQYKPK